MTGKDARLPGEKKSRPRGVVGRNSEVYRSAGKTGGAERCTDCGLVQHGGRWSRSAPAHVHAEDGLCPACRRVRDRYPAGTLHLPLDLCVDREEVLRLIRNTETTEAAEHPLERLMDVVEVDGQLVVTTTGVHLARQIAHRLEKQLHRKPRFRYADGESLVHVEWSAGGGRT